MAGLQVPLEHATLKEFHRGTNGKLIIHLQDAHSNLSGQKNMAGALDRMMTRYGVNLVLVEGSSADVTLDPLKKIGTREQWKRAANRLLYEGLISGEEFLNLTTDHPMKLVGVESQALYDESLQTYSDLVESRQKTLRYLRRIRLALDRVKNKLYPAELLSFEAARGTDGDDFNLRVSKLLELADRAGVALGSEFAETAKLKGLKAREKRIDFEAANREQQRLMEFAFRGKNEEERKALAEAGRRARMQPVATGAFLRALWSEAERSGADRAEFPALAAYADYLEAFGMLRMDGLLEELDRLEDTVYQALLADGEDARMTRACDRFVGLLQKAYQIQMSSNEFAMLRLNEKDFSTKLILGFLNRKLLDLGFADDLTPYQTPIEDARASLERFYELVDRRDLAFLEKSERALSSSDASAAFFIAGGYHTGHLTRLWRDAGYSYAVLTPLVTYETDQDQYESLLLAPLKLARKRAEKSSRETERPIRIAGKADPKKIADGLRKMPAPATAQANGARFAKALVGFGEEEKRQIFLEASRLAAAATVAAQLPGETPAKEAKQLLSKVGRHIDLEYQPRIQEILEKLLAKYPNLPLENFEDVLRALNGIWIQERIDETSFESLLRISVEEGMDFTILARQVYALTDAAGRWKCDLLSFGRNVDQKLEMRVTYSNKGVTTYTVGGENAVKIQADNPEIIEMIRHHRYPQAWSALKGADMMERFDQIYQIHHQQASVDPDGIGRNNTLLHFMAAIARGNEEAKSSFADFVLRRFREASSDAEKALHFRYVLPFADRLQALADDPSLSPAFRIAAYLMARNNSVTSSSSVDREWLAARLQDPKDPAALALREPTQSMHSNLWKWSSESGVASDLAIQMLALKAALTVETIGDSTSDAMFRKIASAVINRSPQGIRSENANDDFQVNWKMVDEWSVWALLGTMSHEAGHNLLNSVGYDLPIADEPAEHYDSMEHAVHEFASDLFSYAALQEWGAELSVVRFEVLDGDWKEHEMGGSTQHLLEGHDVARRTLKRFRERIAEDLDGVEWKSFARRILGELKTPEGRARFNRPYVSSKSRPADLRAEAEKRERILMEFLEECYAAQRPTPLASTGARLTASNKTSNDFEVETLADQILSGESEVSDDFDIPDELRGEEVTPENKMKFLRLISERQNRRKDLYDQWVKDGLVIQAKVYKIPAKTKKSEDNYVPMLDVYDVAREIKKKLGKTNPTDEELNALEFEPLSERDIQNRFGMETMKDDQGQPIQIYLFPHQRRNAYLPIATSLAVVNGIPSGKLYFGHDGPNNPVSTEETYEAGIAYEFKGVGTQAYVTHSEQIGTDLTLDQAKDLFGTLLASDGEARREAEAVAAFLQKEADLDPKRAVSHGFSNTLTTNRGSSIKFRYQGNGIEVYERKSIRSLSGKPGKFIGLRYQEVSSNYVGGLNHQDEFEAASTQQKFFGEGAQLGVWIVRTSTASGVLGGFSERVRTGFSGIRMDAIDQYPKKVERLWKQILRKGGRQNAAPADQKSYLVNKWLPKFVSKDGKNVRAMLRAHLSPHENQGIGKDKDIYGDYYDNDHVDADKLASKFRLDDAGRWAFVMSMQEATFTAQLKFMMKLIDALKQKLNGENSGTGIERAVRIYIEGLLYGSDDIFHGRQLEEKKAATIDAATKILSGKSTGGNRAHQFLDIWNELNPSGARMAQDLIEIRSRYRELLEKSGSNPDIQREKMGGLIRDLSRATDFRYADMVVDATEYFAGRHPVMMRKGAPIVLDAAVVHVLVNHLVRKQPDALREDLEVLSGMVDDFNAYAKRAGIRPTTLELTILSGMSHFFRNDVGYAELNNILKDIPGDLGLRVLALNLFSTGVHLAGGYAETVDTHDFEMVIEVERAIEAIRNGEHPAETVRMLKRGLMRFMVTFSTRFLDEVSLNSENIGASLRALKDLLDREENKQLLREMFRAEIHTGYRPIPGDESVHDPWLAGLEWVFFEDLEASNVAARDLPGRSYSGRDLGSLLLGDMSDPAVLEFIADLRADLDGLPDISAKYHPDNLVRLEDLATYLDVDPDGGARMSESDAEENPVLLDPSVPADAELIDARFRADRGTGVFSIERYSLDPNSPPSVIDPSATRDNPIFVPWTIAERMRQQGELVFYAAPDRSVDRVIAVSLRPWDPARYETAEIAQACAVEFGRLIRDEQNFPTADLIRAEKGDVTVGGLAWTLPHYRPYVNKGWDRIQQQISAEVFRRETQEFMERYEQHLTSEVRGWYVSLDILNEFRRFKEDVYNNDHDAFAGGMKDFMEMIRQRMESGAAPMQAILRSLCAWQYVAAALSNPHDAVPIQNILAALERRQPQTLASLASSDRPDSISLEDIGPADADLILDWNDNQKEFTEAFRAAAQGKSKGKMLVSYKGGQKFLEGFVTYDQFRFGETPVTYLAYIQAAPQNRVNTDRGVIRIGGPEVTVVHPRSRLKGVGTYLMFSVLKESTLQGDGGLVALATSQEGIGLFRRFEASTGRRMLYRARQKAAPGTDGSSASPTDRKNYEEVLNRNPFHHPRILTPDTVTRLTASDVAFGTLEVASPAKSVEPAEDPGDPSKPGSVLGTDAGSRMAADAYEKDIRQKVHEIARTWRTSDTILVNRLDSKSEQFAARMANQRPRDLKMRDWFTVDRLVESWLQPVNLLVTVLGAGAFAGLIAELTGVGRSVLSVGMLSGIADYLGVVLGSGYIMKNYLQGKTMLSNVMYLADGLGGFVRSWPIFATKHLLAIENAAGPAKTMNYKRPYFWGSVLAFAAIGLTVGITFFWQSPVLAHVTIMLYGISAYFEYLSMSENGFGSISRDRAAVELDNFIQSGYLNGASRDVEKRLDQTPNYHPMYHREGRRLRDHVTAIWQSMIAICDDRIPRLIRHDAEAIRLLGFVRDELDRDPTLREDLKHVIVMHDIGKADKGIQKRRSNFLGILAGYAFPGHAKRSAKWLASNSKKKNVHLELHDKKMPKRDRMKTIHYAVRNHMLPIEVLNRQERMASLEEAEDGMLKETKAGMSEKTRAEISKRNLLRAQKLLIIFHTLDLLGSWGYYRSSSDLRTAKALLKQFLEQNPAENRAESIARKSVRRQLYWDAIKVLRLPIPRWIPGCRQVTSWVISRGLRGIGRAMGIPERRFRGVVKRVLLNGSGIEFVVYRDSNGFFPMIDGWEPSWKSEWEREADAEQDPALRLRCLSLAGLFTPPTSASAAISESIYIDGRTADYQRLQQQGRIDELPRIEKARIPYVDSLSGKELEISAYLTLPKGADRETVPIVVLYHGFAMRKETSYFDRLEEQLVSQGIAVLRPDLLGHGESQGTIHHERDLDRYNRAIFDYIDSRPELAKKRIGLFGFSFGGYLAMRAALRRDAKERVLAVPLLNAPSRSTFLTLRNLRRHGSYMRHLFDVTDARELIRKMGIFGFNVDAILTRFIDSEKIDAAGKSIMRDRVLVIQGDRDTTISAQDQKGLSSAATLIGVTPIVLEESGHLPTGRAQKKAFEAVTKFLIQRLAPERAEETEEVGARLASIQLGEDALRRFGSAEVNSPKRGGKSSEDRGMAEQYSPQGKLRDDIEVYAVLDGFVGDGRGGQTELAMETIRDGLARSAEALGTAEPSDEWTIEALATAMVAADGKMNAANLAARAPSDYVEMKLGEPIPMADPATTQIQDLSLTGSASASIVMVVRRPDGSTDLFTAPAGDVEAKLVFPDEVENGDVQWMYLAPTNVIPNHLLDQKVFSFPIPGSSDEMKVRYMEVPAEGYSSRDFASRPMPKDGGSNIDSQFRNVYALAELASEEDLAGPVHGLSEVVLRSLFDSRNLISNSLGASVDTDRPHHHPVIFKYTIPAGRKARLLLHSDGLDSLTGQEIANRAVQGSPSEAAAGLAQLTQQRWSDATNMRAKRDDVTVEISDIETKAPAPVPVSDLTEEDIDAIAIGALSAAALLKKNKVGLAIVSGYREPGVPHAAETLIRKAWAVRGYPESELPFFWSFERAENKKLYEREEVEGALRSRIGDLTSEKSRIQKLGIRSVEELRAALNAGELTAVYLDDHIASAIKLNAVVNAFEAANLRIQYGALLCRVSENLIYGSWAGAAYTDAHKIKELNSGPAIQADLTRVGTAIEGLAAGAAVASAGAIVSTNSFDRSLLELLDEEGLDNPLQLSLPLRPDGSLPENWMSAEQEAIPGRNRILGPLSPTPSEPDVRLTIETDAFLFWMKNGQTAGMRMDYTRHGISYVSTLPFPLSALTDESLRVLEEMSASDPAAAERIRQIRSEKKSMPADGDPAADGGARMSATEEYFSEAQTDALVAASLRLVRSIAQNGTDIVFFSGTGDAAARFFRSAWEREFPDRRMPLPIQLQFGTSENRTLYKTPQKNAWGDEQIRREIDLLFEAKLFGDGGTMRQEFEQRPKLKDIGSLEAFKAALQSGALKMTYVDEYTQTAMKFNALSLYLETAGYPFTFGVLSAAVPEILGRGVLVGLAGSAEKPFNDPGNDLAMGFLMHLRDINQHPEYLDYLEGQIRTRPLPEDSDLSSDAAAFVTPVVFESGLSQLTPGLVGTGPQFLEINLVFDEVDLAAADPAQGRVRPLRLRHAVQGTEQPGQVILAFKTDQLVKSGVRLLFDAGPNRETMPAIRWAFDGVPLSALTDDSKRMLSELQEKQTDGSELEGARLADVYTIGDLMKVRGILDRAQESPEEEIVSELRKVLGASKALRALESGAIYPLLAGALVELQDAALRTSTGETLGSVDLPNPEHVTDTASGVDSRSTPSSLEIPVDALNGVRADMLDRLVARLFEGRSGSILAAMDPDMPEMRGEDGARALAIAMNLIGWMKSGGVEVTLERQTPEAFAAAAPGFDRAFYIGSEEGLRSVDPELLKNKGIISVRQGTGTFNLALVILIQSLLQLEIKKITDDTALLSPEERQNAVKVRLGRFTQDANLLFRAIWGRRAPTLSAVEAMSDLSDGNQIQIVVDFSVPAELKAADLDSAQLSVGATRSAA